MPSQMPKLLHIEITKNLAKRTSGVIWKNNYLKSTYLNCLNFEDTYLSVLNKHAPCKQKLIRANESPFMNKHLKKSIMSRSRLRNKFLKDKTAGK